MLLITKYFKSKSKGDVASGVSKSDVFTRLLDVNAMALFDVIDLY